MILHLYFARRFTAAFFAITSVLFALVVLIDAVDQTRRFGGLDLGWQRLLGLTLLNTPQTLNTILPLIMILATVTLFVTLSRSSELVVTRAAGRSALSALLAPIVMALIIGVIAVAMLNPIVAATNARYIQLSDSYQTGGSAALSVSDEGLWLRQGSAEGQSVIRAWRANEDASILYEVTVLTYDADNSPLRRIEAASAQLSDGTWTLTGAKSWPLLPGQNAEANAEEFDVLELRSSLTLERIRETIGAPGAVSIYDLPEFVVQLEQAGLSAVRHRVWLQTEFARPLFLTAMVLLAAAFTMRHTRFGGTGVAVLSAILLGFGMYFIRRFAQILGENGQIPVLLSAWAPPIAALCLAVGLLLHAEDG